MFTITRTEILTIVPMEAEHIFHQYLTHLKAGRWVERGKLREEHVTSHRYDADCDDQSDLELVQAVQNLERILTERKKRT